ncbi:MAG TPA: ABC transporter substrate-binding protein [Candidatus Binatia bacterium]|jgi:iron(III) transport system substrate-binding protein
MKQVIIWATIVMIAACFSSSDAASPDDLFSEINRLSAVERQKRLEEGAKKEGSVKVFTITYVTLIQAYLDAFMKKYPFIRAEYWRGSGNRLVNRVLTEHRLGKLEADIVSVPNEVPITLKKEGVWARYRSPELTNYPAAFYDEGGYWSSTHLGLAAIAYNAKLVKSQDAPKDYPDLLDPKWKGELSIDLEPERALQAWLAAWGEARTRDFLTKLLQNGAVVRRGHTLQLELLCAGEFKIGVELYPDSVARMKHEKKCPVNIVYPDPTPAQLGTISGIASRASHPHAAALLIDFILSGAGAEILARTGQLTGRKGIKPPYEELDLESKRVRLTVISPQKANELLPATAKIMQEFLSSKKF